MAFLSQNKLFVLIQILDKAVYVGKVDKKVYDIGPRKKGAKWFGRGEQNGNRDWMKWVSWRNSDV